MATITVNIQINKARVMDEVAKTTAYIGKKSTTEEDPGAFNRVATTDANREQLDRYWMEGCSGASLLLDHWMKSVDTQVLTHHPELDRDYKATLAMPTNWPSQYQTTLHEALTSYLVNFIVSKWLLIAMPSQAEAYAALASGAGLQIESILLMRQRPTPRRSVKPGDDVEGNTWNGSAIWVGTNVWGQ